MTDEQRWYTADHYDSDSYYHTYCGTCYDQIPSWLIRYSYQKTAPYIVGGEPAECEGCGAVANNDSQVTQ